MSLHVFDYLEEAHAVHWANVHQHHSQQVVWQQEMWGGGAMEPTQSLQTGRRRQSRGWYQWVWCLRLLSHTGPPAQRLPAHTDTLPLMTTHVLWVSDRNERREEKDADVMANKVKGAIMYRVEWPQNKLLPFSFWHFLSLFQYLQSGHITPFCCLGCVVMYSCCWCRHPDTVCYVCLQSLGHFCYPATHTEVLTHTGFLM